MKIGSYTLEVTRPAIMGIINTTPDSFSDGGKYRETSQAIAYALRLADEGADIIDIGGESTRPGALPVSVDEETARTIPAIAGIRKKSSIPISIDTTKSLVALRALDAGADMINDVSAGRFDGEMLSLAAQRKVPVCLMHMQGTPATMQTEPHYNDVIGEIAVFLRDAILRALASGVERSQIIIDPGIGFGKTAEDNLKILNGLDEFRKLNAPILIGTSRKSFIGKLLNFDLNERTEATLATLAVARDRGASILRVHDVLASRRFIVAYSKFRGCRYNP